MTFGGISKQQSQKSDDDPDNDQYCSFHFNTIEGLQHARMVHGVS
jgi:hypothetical protein